MRNIAVAIWPNFLSKADIQDKLIADVGSGAGMYSRALNEDKARTVCVDLSFNSLLHCRRLNPESKIICGSALDLPFPNSTFDHVITMGVLHHTPDCRLGF